MKMEALSCMIKPCFLVNFQTAINASLFLAKCTYPNTTYIIKYFSLALQSACSSLDNPLNHNNHTAVNNHKLLQLPS